MLIREVDESATQRLKLAALSTFLTDRATDEAAQQEISQDAFIELAQDLGVNITKANLGELASQDPLKNLLEPIDPTSNVVRFKGNTQATTGMTVNQAQDVVDKNAKAAMKRGMKSAS